MALPRLGRRRYGYLPQRDAAVAEPQQERDDAYAPQAPTDRDGGWGKPLIRFGQPSELSRYVGREQLGLEPISPISVRRAGDVHARFGAQAEYVLDRENGGICHRSQGAPQQVPVRFATVAARVGKRAVALPLELLAFARIGGARRRVQKTDHRVVVVGTGVNHAALVKAMRQIRLGPVGERKRQDAHARQLEVVT